MPRNFFHCALVVTALFAFPAAAQAAEGGEGSLIAVRPLGAPIIENGRVNGQVRVVLRIVPQSETAGIEISAKVQAWQAKLMTALNEFARLNVSVYRPVDTVKLKAALLAALNEDGAGAKDIIILDVVAY